MHRSMKTFLIILITGLTLNVFPQQANFRTYSSVIKLIAYQGNEKYEWENKDNVVFLNYKTGDIIIRLHNKDFYNPLHPAPVTDSDTDIDVEDREFVFKGILPIRDIINQKTNTQKYTVELQLICDDLRLNEPVNFEMTIMRPGNSADQNYRIFSLDGILYNDRLNIPLFEGFNNEVELFINFNGYFEGSY